MTSTKLAPTTGECAMNTSADQPSKPTLPNSAAPTLPPGARSPSNGSTDATNGVKSGTRAGMSDTQATVPAFVSGTAETQIAGPNGLSGTDATALNVGSATATSRVASGSYHNERWGDFILGTLLGRGGMGSVYSGRQVSLDRPVAIKVLSEHLSGSDDFRKRFLLEARAAARINSPHVVQVYFAGSHHEVDFFAMEFVEGTDLAKKLKDGWRPSPAECLTLITQAVRSLVALGEHKIVHRDIKPANYMLTTSGQLKLMDFGLVKFATESHGLTQAGTVMGTVNYFSPEQGRGEICDQRTDLYALGVMFYELLTGKLPFTGGDATSVIYQHIHAEPKPPKIHNPAVTEPYQSVVLKCLEKNPADRYQSAAELLGDLERMARGEHPLLIGRKKSTSENLGTTPNHRRLTLAAAVIIAAVILSLAIIMRPSHPVAVAISDPPLTGAPIPTAPVPAPTITASAVPTSPATAPAVVSAPPIVIAQVPQAPVISEPPSIKPSEKPPIIEAPVAAPVVQPPAKPTEIPAPPIPPVVIASIPLPAEAPAKTVTSPAVKAPVAIVVESTPSAAPAKPVESEVTQPLPAPTKPAAPITVIQPANNPLTISTPIQTTVRIAIPTGDALLHASTWLWWLDGPNGHSGRLSARTTRVPEISWTAPALPSEVTLHVAAVGVDRQLSVPLKAVIATSEAATTLTPFLRAHFSEERHVQRLRPDLDGNWWLIDTDSAIISRNSAGWLSGGRFLPTPAPTRPVTVATSPDRIAVLNSDPASLIIYGRDNLAQRTITGLQRPTDVVALSDGTWAVADMRLGGVLVFDQQGVRIRTHVRSGTGGWDLLTRLACDGNLLYALDSTTPVIAVFGDEAQPLAIWPQDRASRPIAIAAQSGRVYVLSTSGAIRVLDPRGQLLLSMPSAVGALPDEALGAPSDVTVNSLGEVFVTYPEREMIARHSADGKQLHIRHARAWTWRAYAADGANHLYALDPDHHRVVVLDQDGWRLTTLGKATKQGGTFESPLALAVHPDGAALAVLDEKTRQITRFDLTNGTSLVFGGAGKTDGLFDAPVSSTMDQDGRTYVLDGGLHRVSVFDAQGHFQCHIGRYERGDAPDLLRAPRLVAVSPDGAKVFIYDEDVSLIKSFSIDHTNNHVRHLGNFGGRGTAPGQFLRLTGMNCDRRGRLYCLDYKREDLQVFNLAANAPTLITGLRGETYGIRKLLSLALNPEGIAFIIGGDQLTGLRWQP